MAWHDALTKEEEQFISKHVKDMSISEIATSLGRSYYTIQKHTDKIGHHPIHKWTEEEDNVLLTLYGTYMVEYIARVLNLDANCVYNRIRRLRKNGKLK